jgi:hypothetical protein
LPGLVNSLAAQSAAKLARGWNAIALFNVLFMVAFPETGRSVWARYPQSVNYHGEISDLAFGDAEMPCREGACHVFLAFYL